MRTALSDALITTIASFILQMVFRSGGIAEDTPSGAGIRGIAHPPAPRLSKPDIGNPGLSKSRSPGSLETAVGSRIDGIVQPAELCSFQIATSTEELKFPALHAANLNLRSKNGTKTYIC